MWLPIAACSSGRNSSATPSIPAPAASSTRFSIAVPKKILALTMFRKMMAVKSTATRPLVRYWVER